MSCFHEVKIHSFPDATPGPRWSGGQDGWGQVTGGGQEGRQQVAGGAQVCLGQQDGGGQKGTRQVAGLWSSSLPRNKYI